MASLASPLTGGANALLPCSWATLHKTGIFVISAPYLFGTQAKSQMTILQLEYILKCVHV
jgi:hypothetical protein